MPAIDVQSLGACVGAMLRHIDSSKMVVFGLQYDSLTILSRLRAIHARCDCEKANDGEVAHLGEALRDRKSAWFLFDGVPTFGGLANFRETQNRR